LVSVSCERIKAGVVRLLGLPEGHYGRILIFIRHGHPADQPLLIESTPFANGWQYSISVPETIAWPRFVRGIVEAVLLDAANPDPGRNLAPIPLWLSEGASFLLINNSGRELVPEPNREFKDARRGMDPSAAIMNRLEGQSPMEFSALSLPSDYTVSDAAKFSAFQASSALLVHELGRLGGPQTPIRSLIQALQGHLNWQTAMLEAWADRFQSLLEIEKWWAVQSTSRMLRNPGRLWSRQATVAQLTSVLTETAAAATGTNGPVPRTQRLSEVVVQWPYSAQVEVLDRKILQLRNLFLFADADLLDLVRDTHSTLQEYQQSFFQKALAGLPIPGFTDPVITSYNVAACGSGLKS
jgi:hypothetical protein